MKIKTSFPFALLTLILTLGSSAHGQSQTAKYYTTDETWLAIRYTDALGGGLHPYSGIDLEPITTLTDANLSYANLFWADLTGGDALLNFTVQESDNLIDWSDTAESTTVTVPAPDPGKKFFRFSGPE